MNTSHTVTNMCFECKSRFDSIGLTKPCVICFLKKACKNESCLNVVDGNNGFCQSCSMQREIISLRNENKRLKDIILTYEEKPVEKLRKELGFDHLPPGKLVIDS